MPERTLRAERIGRISPLDGANIYGVERNFTFGAAELEGVDLFGGGGLLSVRHTTDDIEFTISAFDRALDRMDEDGFFE